MGKYTQKNLGSNERVISEAQLHAIVLLPHILLMLIVIGFFTIISPLVSLFTTELAVTNKNVIGKRGLIGRRTLSTPLNKINNVSVDVGIMGRLLKYGTIVITSSSGKYEFPYIKNPDAFKNAVLAQIDIFDEERIKRQALEMASAMKKDTE